MSPFQSLREYEAFIYRLPQEAPRITRSTLIVIQRGRRFAELTGELAFVNQCRLVVYERLSWQQGPLVIVGYSYEVWQADNKIYWYDSQPHPNDPALETTDPHHKHVPPDIKHHRVPAPNLSFSQPNLPYLIAEVESWVPGSS